MPDRACRRRPVWRENAWVPCRRWRASRPDKCWSRQRREQRWTSWQPLADDEPRTPAAHPGHTNGTSTTTNANRYCKIRQEDSRSGVQKITGTPTAIHNARKDPEHPPHTRGTNGTLTWNTHNKRESEQQQDTLTKWSPEDDWNTYSNPQRPGKTRNTREYTKNTGQYSTRVIAKLHSQRTRLTARRRDVSGITTSTVHEQSSPDDYL